MLVLEEQQADFWLSLTGEKKILSMPTMAEIEAFCERVDQGEIYVEYEKQYFEFDDTGRYMGSWKLWHVDVCAAMPFLDRVFAGCHDLLRLEEYELAADILGRVCALQFAVIKAQDCEEEPERAFFTLTEAEDCLLYTSRCV